MGLKEILKKGLPFYRAENRILNELQTIKKELREIDSKTEYLFWLSQIQEGESIQEVKERVFLRMPKATSRLRNIQMAENYILQRVKDVCDANDMHLFLVGGTLLGAVRHKGFIPWDNDIDIGMMKQDYLKLRELLSQDSQLKVSYCYKYKDGLKISKVKFREVDVFWIDILVFDYIDVTEDTLEDIWKKTQEANKCHIKKIKELSRNRHAENYVRPVEDEELDQETARFEEEQMKEFPFFGHGKYFCEPINCPWWSRDERGIRLVEDYFPLLVEELEFEGRKYDVWKNYDRALHFSYGDIWKLPFSINEPHTTEFDEGLEEGFQYLRKCGIIE